MQLSNPAHQSYMKPLLALCTALLFIGSSTYDFLDDERDQAIADYETYLATEITDIGWTGDADKCKPGEISESTVQNALARINYFRRLVGLNDDIVFDHSYDQMAQEAALIMHANNRLSHNPNSGWHCYSDDGKEGATGSNLSQLANEDLRHIITDLIEDGGEYNQDVGHRRWLLNSAATTMGFGATSVYYAVHVTGDENRGTAADAPEFTSWPPQGYLPYQLAFKRWSFSIPLGSQVSFASAKVKIKANGRTIATDIESRSANFGDPTIVWNIPDMKEEFFYDYYDMAMKKENLEDIGILENKIEVSIENVIVDGESKNYEYEVWLIDPEAETNE